MSFFLLTMQSYGDFLPIPRNSPNSSLTCSDNRPHRRHIRQMPSETVAHKGHPTHIEGTVPAVIQWVWMIMDELGWVKMNWDEVSRRNVVILHWQWEDQCDCELRLSIGQASLPHCIRLASQLSGGKGLCHECHLSLVSLRISKQRKRDPSQVPFFLTTSKYK